MFDQRTIHSILPAVPRPNFSHVYFDLARSGDNATLKKASDNIALMFPEYSLDRIFIRNDRITLQPQNGTQSFLALESGLAHVSYSKEGQLHRNALLRSGDLLILSAGDSVDIDPQKPGAFFHISVKAEDAVIPGRRGITLLSDLPNMSGGCNPGGNQPDPTRDFRRVVHVSTDLGAGRSFPKMDIYAVQLLRERSHAHYHPNVSIGGPANQHELYLFLDPANLGLSVPSERFLTTWAPGAPKAECVSIAISPGDLASIPAGVGHHAQGMALIFAFPGTMGLPNAVGIGKLPNSRTP